MRANLPPLRSDLDVFYAHSNLFPWERVQFSTPRSARRPKVRVFGSFPSQPLLTPCGFLSLFFSLFIFEWFFSMCMSFLFFASVVSRGGGCVLPSSVCVFRCFSKEKEERSLRSFRSFVLIVRKRKIVCISVV